MIWLPPETPDLPDFPENYTPWQKYDKDIYKPLLRISRNAGTLSIPYSFSDTNFVAVYSGGDSLSNYVHYITDTSIWLKNNWRYGEVYIRWYPHQSDLTRTEENLLPLHSYWHSWSLFLSLDKRGFDNINIGENKAYRQKGWFWAGQCDWSSQWVGSYTTYFIPTESYDFRITCLSTTYTYSSEGGEFGPEHYPDRISELEQAVEQTFRVK